MHTESSLRRKLAGALERGAPFAPFGVRRRVKTIALPPHARVIGIGGATIGGSGKTPLAIAIVRALVERGERAVFVAHGYGACVGRARRVEITDDPTLVGDESLIAARQLESIAPVVVGSDRTQAIDFAAASGETLVVDHLHQTRPRPLDRAVLAVDARAPWGSARRFPFGDLVASPEALLAAADVVVHIGSDDARDVVGDDARDVVAVFRSARVGVITSVARPQRVLATLREAGVAPVVHVARADHAPIRGEERVRLVTIAARHRLDVWLADEKSAVWLGAHAGAPIAPIRHHLVLAPAIVDRIARSC